MARSIDATKRREVLEYIRQTFGTPEFSTRKVAKRFGISEYSVRQIGREGGMSSLASVATRELVKNAIEQQRSNDAERRTALASRMLDVAENALDDMSNPCVVYNFGGKENSYNEHELSKPGFADQRNLMIIAATAIDKHRVLDQYDAVASRASAFDAWLADMTGQPTEATKR